jgi:hypothetical protein
VLVENAMAATARASKTRRFIELSFRIPQGSSRLRPHEHRAADRGLFPAMLFPGLVSPACGLLEFGS